jgi:hypothetical protein
MARYLIKLAKETGEGRHLNVAVSMLDGIVGRLESLGLSVRSTLRASEQPRISTVTSTGVWELHASLIETMLDLPGLDYIATSKTLRLSPSLPGSWPSIGIAQKFLCGDVSFRLDRPVGGSVHELRISSQLEFATQLEIEITCSGLTQLGPWRAEPDGAQPSFDPKKGRLTWSVELPAGKSDRVWSWG